MLIAPPEPIAWANRALATLHLDDLSKDLLTGAVLTLLTITIAPQSEAVTIDALDTMDEVALGDMS